MEIKSDQIAYHAYIMGESDGFDNFPGYIDMGIYQEDYNKGYDNGVKERIRKNKDVIDG